MSGAQVARLCPALDRQTRQPDGSDPLHARCSTGRAAMPRARNSSASHAGSSRRARVERIDQRRRARDPPAHPRAAEVRGAAQPHQPAGRAAAFRRDRQPPRRGEVERARVAPQFADHGGEAGASYPFLHRPQRVAGVARFDMDEVLAGKPGGWIRPLSRIAIRSWTHSSGLSVIELRPAGTPPSRRRADARRRARRGWGWTAQAGASARPTPRGETIECSAGPERARRQLRRRPETSLLPHDSQRFCSTFVLISRVRSRSQSCELGHQPLLFEKPPISRTTSRAARAETPNAMCVQSSSTALSRSCSSPRAERGAISPSLRDQKASCGTGGLSVTRGIGGSSTL